jgi:hypothetical protein
MSFKPMLMASALLMLVGCGPETGETTASGPTDSAVPMQDTEQSGGGVGELKISPRTYTGGSVKAHVTGFFQVDGNQTLNVPASLTEEDQTWLQYGVSGAQELNALFTNSTAMAEHGVTVAIGPYIVTATSTSGECRTKVDVTPTLVAGRYSCTGSTGYNNQTGQMGKVDVEVEFSAGS